MTINFLEHFPDVCRLCLQPRAAPEMIPIDGTQPEFDVQLADLLDDFCFPVPEDTTDSLPLAVCEQCQQDFIAAYKMKQRANFLLNFQVSYVRFMQGEVEPLQQLFEEHHDYMSVLFQEMGLSDQEELCWEDLIGDPICTAQPIKEESSEENTAVILADGSDQSHVFEVELLQEGVAGQISEQMDEIEIEYLEMEEEELETPAKRQKKVSKPKKSPTSKVKSEEPLSCDKCKFVTFYKDTFEYHQQKHQEKEAQNEWICGIDDCQEQFDSKELVVRHKKEVHQCCVCDICGVVLKNKYSLDVHVRRHKGETRFSCDYCPSTFYTAQEHKLHLGLVHVASENVKCDVCGLEFKNATCLKRHMKSHSEVRSYKCSYCEMAFKTTMHLHRHKETIHMKVRFGCDYCEMSYGRKDKLRMHVERAHNIQTYFLCDICLKSFSTGDQLREHMGYHAEPKPLECAICLVAYLTQEEFDKHLCISYRKDYVCCGRDFKFHTFYNKHMFLAHGKKTNVRVKPVADKLIANVRAERKQEERCSSCEKTFASRKLKNAHKKVCSGKKKQPGSTETKGVSVK